MTLTAVALLQLTGCMPLFPSNGLVPETRHPAIVPAADPAVDPYAALILLLRTGPDRDGDGIPDVLEDTNGPDSDGDGIPNEIDPDVDGDGILNRYDPDIDGDGIFNGFDFDPDGDGLVGDADPDEDGDGLSDRWDLDDQGDAKADDEEESGGGDEKPDDKLLDLVGRLRDGTITEQDRTAIAREISTRFESGEKAFAIQEALATVLTLTKSEKREAPETTIPVTIAAVDAVYEQLAAAIDTAKKARPKTKQPLTTAQLQSALKDFVSRAEGVVNTAQAFPSLSINEVSNYVKELAGTYTPDRLKELTSSIWAYTQEESRGDAGKERADFQQLVSGLTRLGSTFKTSHVHSLLEGVAQLRDFATERNRDDPAAIYDQLVDRAVHIADESESPISSSEAIAQAVSENETPPPSEGN